MSSYTLKKSAIASAPFSLESMSLFLSVSSALICASASMASSNSRIRGLGHCRQHMCQIQRVPESQIDALTGPRCHQVGRVADQCRARSVLSAVADGEHVVRLDVGPVAGIVLGLLVARRGEQVLERGGLRAEQLVVA